MIKRLKIILSVLVIQSLVVSFSYSEEKEVKDCFEKINRATFAFNMALDKVLFRPVAAGYRKLPSPVRSGTSNALNNLSNLVTIPNNILQGDFRSAGNNTIRLIINTTIGIVGIFDPANALGFEKLEKEDFGQTLAVHGVGPGPYLMLPFLGPSTLRDALGKITSLYADPVTLALERNDKDQWIWIGMAVKGVDFREQNLEKIDNLNATSVDFYATLRSLYLERRSSMIRNQNVNDTDPFQEFDVE